MRKKLSQRNRKQYNHIDRYGFSNPELIKIGLYSLQNNIINE